jgi:hypothetical protein
MGNEVQIEEQNDWAKYPMTLRPKHIEEILGRSQKSIYELLKESPFHIGKAGRDIYISKSIFRKWLEGEETHSEGSKGA